mmetsp:Transcript_46230/g.104173  ORF Transcript_46230/g.104173 Transcript_46230/m.104173 type:complete len:315 (+) Transcript_46230:431-1375(+)
MHPRCRLHAAPTCASRQSTRIGQRGRNFESKRAELPVRVSVMISAASLVMEASTTALATASAGSTGDLIVMSMSAAIALWKSAASASRQTLAIVETASFGYLPLAVSPDSITQSAPSSTAFATSLASARVGRGLLVIDSSIWVAQITGLPAMLHLAIIIFCARNTFSVGISIPRSPRATITPSVSARISSKLRIPSWFSIFEMIRMRFPTTGSASVRHLRTSRTSDALRMNDAKIMSTSCPTPHARSFLSFSDSAGRSTSTSGRLHPFFDPSDAVFTTSHVSDVALSIDFTLSASRPSSTKMIPPTATTFGRLA